MSENLQTKQQHRLGNPRLSPKDHNAIKGAIRRAFARSDLHKKIMDAATIEHVDPARPRCKKWVRCATCRHPSPKWSSEVDHIDPVIPIDKTLAEMSLDEVASRTWCEESNLQVLCETCHDEKTAKERQARDASKIARGLKKPPKRKKSAIA